MRAEQKTDDVRLRGSGTSRDVSANQLQACETAAVTRACCLLIVCLLSGCSSPPALEHEADARAKAVIDARVVPVRGWPCDHAALDSPHCRLQAAEGFVRRITADSMRFEDVELDATLTARIIQGPPGAGTDDQAQQIMEAWKTRLSPAVTWDQDPQGPVGFEVRGISGSEPIPFTAYSEPGPQQFHVVSYRNPKTGSILLLEARAAQTHWKQVWPRMAPVFAAVRLSEEF